MSIWALGRPWGRQGRPRSNFDRFGVDLGARLGSQNRPKSIKNRCQDVSNLCISFRIHFLSIFIRFWAPFGHHFGPMLGIIWSIGEIAKNIKNTMVFKDFSRFRGSKLASFSYVFGVSLSTSFFDRLGVDFGADLGAILAPKWVHVASFGVLIWCQFLTSISDPRPGALPPARGAAPRKCHG